jgi:exopolyphosphatase / guanosine-5'-triphosphate,3'-diphosphate pyrophosphatase
MAKLAVIDVGTNSIHMVLADVLPDGSYKIVDRFKDITRLGDGSFTARRLSDEAVTRGLDVLRKLVTLARNKGFERIEAVATSAVREARNGGEFVELVSKELGLTIHVISGTEEARLIYVGVRNSIALSDEPSVIVDVGGGSLELILGNRQGLIQAKSLKLGAIRLADQFLSKPITTDAMLKGLEESVTGQFERALASFKLKGAPTIVATSGMAGNIGDIIHWRQTGRALSQVNLATVALKDMLLLEKQLAQSSAKERLAIPGLDPKRVDTLLPATLVLRRLLQLLGADQMTLCDKAIREGVIYDFIEHHREGLRAEQDIPDLRRRNVIGLARRCRAPEVHSLHVAGLAVRLFDQTQPLHQLGGTEREWLEYAAVLHDVGYLINPRQHHKHAYYVIKYSDLSGFTAEDIAVIANIARYHRGALPAMKHEPFGELKPGLQRIVKILGAFLRLADALDRTHFSVVQTVHVTCGTRLQVQLIVSGEAEMELWTAKRRGDLLEEVFHRPVEFSVVPAVADGAH